MTAFTTSDVETLRSVLQGQYHLERELGRGGMGVVYLARDERLDRPVALKVLPPTLARDEGTRTRFLREARLAAQLSHPHIVPVYRADELDGFAFFAMGYVDGETFGARIRDRERLGATETVRVLREVAWALAYAHARGIVHRDVKPENILLERGSGRALVTDFGIARSSVDAALTADGHVLGTVHFMSPEQCTGDPVDGRSDLYALGVTGFYALSGRLPFDGDAPQAVIVAHATRAAPPLLSVAPDVPPALAAVIDRCLQKDSAARIPTGEALAEALTKALESSPESPRAPARVLHTEQAHAVWRRAAQLQAEAATRLETRLRADGSADRVATSPPHPRVACAWPMSPPPPWKRGFRSSTSPSPWPNSSAPRRRCSAPTTSPAGSDSSPRACSAPATARSPSRAPFACHRAKRSPRSGARCRRIRTVSPCATRSVAIRSTAACSCSRCRPWSMARTSGRTPAMACTCPSCACRCGRWRVTPAPAT
jgi:serine/threonine protein kinase